MGTFDFRQRKAIEKSYTEKLEKLFPNEVKDKSGIYAFLRKDNGFMFCYCGQAKNVKNRVLAHLIEHRQHIDNSLSKRGLFDSISNRGGWQIKCFYYNENELDEKERYHIKRFADLGYQLYNTTAGGQDSGKVLLTENSGGKGYRQGVEYGKQKTLEKIAEYFEKYLDFDIKEPKYNKNGKINALKEKKYKEFEELINGKANEVDK